VGEREATWGYPGAAVHRHSVHAINDYLKKQKNGRNSGVVAWEMPDQPFTLGRDLGALIKLEHGYHWVFTRAQWIT